MLNIAPFSYFNIVTANPPIVSVSLQRKNDSLRDTARNLLKNKEAVIHVVDVENVDDANETAASLRPDESELDKTNFTVIPSKTMETPSLEESKVRFEVELYEHVLVENEGEPTADLMLLKINHYHIDDDLYHEGRIDPIGLGAVSRLAGHDYGEIGKIFTRARPE